MKRMLSILVMLSTILACKEKPTQDLTAEYEMRSDTILVTPNGNLARKLRIDTVPEQSFEREMRSEGVVKAIPNHYAEIAPPFSGRIGRVYARLGMKTVVGTPLFELASPEFMDAQKQYFHAKSEMESNQLKLKRQLDLHQNGVGSQKDLEQARLESAISQKEYQHTRQVLTTFGAQPDRMQMGQPLVITSPIVGEVIENELVSGHYLKLDDPAHVKVAALTKVWVVGMVKEKDIRYIHEQDSAEIRVAAFPDRITRGKVYHVNEIVDDETRSVQVMIACDNPDRTLKPGMYVSVSFKDPAERALFVPATAVLQFNEESFVFVEVSPYVYQRRLVSTGISKAGYILIEKGLTSADRIIVEGAFYLLEAK